MGDIVKLGDIVPTYGEMEPVIVAEETYQGLRAAAANMQGIVVEIERDKKRAISGDGLQSYTTIYVRFPPIRLGKETYDQMYLELIYCTDYHDWVNRYGRLPVPSMYQNTEKKKHNIQPHVGIRRMCWYGHREMNRALARKDWKMAIVMLVQSIVTVSGTHWHYGLSGCKEPGCDGYVRQSFHDFCAKHQKVCKHCGPIPNYVKSDGYCVSCGPPEICYVCNEPVPQNKARRSRVGNSYRYSHYNCKNKAIQCSRCRKEVERGTVTILANNHKLCPICMANRKQTTATRQRVRQQEVKERVTRRKKYAGSPVTTT